MRPHCRRALYGTGLASSLLAAPADAQPVGLEMGAGLAIPAGGFGAMRGAGPLVQVGAVQRDSTRRFRWRAQLEAAWMPGNNISLGWRDGDARVMSGLVGFTLGQRGTDGLYLLFAIGRHQIKIEGAPNPYGTLWGTRVGLGARWRIGRLRGRAELAPHVILSDYGTTEYSPGTFWAAVAGVTF